MTKKAINNFCNISCLKWCVQEENNTRLAACMISVRMPFVAPREMPWENKRYDQIIDTLTYTNTDHLTDKVGVKTLKMQLLIFEKLNSYATGLKTWVSLHLLWKSHCLYESMWKMGRNLEYWTTDTDSISITDKVW